MDTETSNQMYDEYARKPPGYFTGARSDYIRQLPLQSAAKILEVGCGTGDTGMLALSEEKCGWYCGVELCESVAEEAKQKISEVVVGNVESIAFPWPEKTFDVLIISEVLEHLVDPWKVLLRLHPLMKPGALVFSSSPNVSHYRIIKMLLKGEWQLEDFGVMDRTHLRWFTPATYRKMFEECGYKVESIGPVTPMAWRTRVLNAVTLDRFRHAFFVQISLQARVPERESPDAN